MFIVDLVTRIIDTSECTDISRIECFMSLIKLCPSAQSFDDIASLRKLKDYILTGQIQAIENDHASELHVAKWQLLTRLIDVNEVELAASDLDLHSVLSLMLADRFVSTEVLTAMAQWLVQLNSRNALLLGDLLGMKMTEEKQVGACLDLIKQMYVTLRNFSLRQSFAEMLEKVVNTKEQAKQVITSGMLRTLLQVAMEHLNDILHADLLQNFILVGSRIASLVCFGATATNIENKTDVVIPTKRRVVCELVVTLMLSRISLVVADALRMLQLLIDNEPCRALLPAVPDLRGALDKVHLVLHQKDSKLSNDEYLKALFQVQYQLLRPDIDAYEHEYGSVIDLPRNDKPLDGGNHCADHALDLATRYKMRGNAFFRRENYPTALVFYRRAISVLKNAQLHEETVLRSLSLDELLTRCSIGASVQVCSDRGDDWQDAIVSDVEDKGTSSQIEVLYDAGDREDEWVAISRIQLRMNTALLTAFDDLAVDCSMNMGKAFSALGDYDQAIQCFTNALALRGGKLVSALYYRGVAHMASRDLTAAQQDLWNANQQCRAQEKHSSVGGTSQTTTRDTEQRRAFHKQIVAAYKKLQQLHANKKRLDKKVIKQMLKYLSAIPGVQDEEGDAGPKEFK